MKLSKATIVLGTLSVVATAVLFWLLESEQPSTEHEHLHPSPDIDVAVDEFAATQSQYSTSDLATSSYTSIDKKLNQQRANATQNTGLTETELNAARSAVYEAFYDPQSSAKVMTEIHEQLTNHVGAAEADFLFAIVNAGSDWEKAKQLLNERESSFGDSHRYDALLLDTGINSGEISAEEVETLVSRGTAILPDNIVYRMANNGNIEAIKGLADRGLLGYPNYEHPTLSMNAIGAFIHHASLNPDNYDPALVQEQLSVLIDVGIEIQPTSGALDPLDLALQRTYDENADVKYAMVKTLIRKGVRVEESHREALRRMPDGVAKDRLERLLANNL